MDWLILYYICMLICKRNLLIELKWISIWFETDLFNERSAVNVARCLTTLFRAWWKLTPPLNKLKKEWNILWPGLSHGIWNFTKWSIPEKLLNMIMLSFSGIWNIPGIFQKNATSKVFHFLKMEYSELFQRKAITTKSGYVFGS